MKIFGLINAAAAVATNPGRGEARFLAQGWPLKSQMLRDFKAKAERCGVTLTGVIDNRPDLQFNNRLSMSGYNDAREHASSGESGITVNRAALTCPLQFKSYCNLHRRLFGTNPGFYIGPEDPEHLFDRARVASDLVRFILGAPCTIYIDGYEYRKMLAIEGGTVQDYDGFEANVRSMQIEVRGEYDPNRCLQEPRPTVPQFLKWDHYTELDSWGAVPPSGSVVEVDNPEQARLVAAYTPAQLDIFVPISTVSDADLREMGEVAQANNGEGVAV